MLQDKQFYTIRELAREKVLTEYAIRKLVETNQIPHIKCGNKVLIKRDSFIACLIGYEGEE